MAERLALVTGSRGGIGAAVCRQMGSAGMRVVGVDHPRTTGDGNEPMSAFWACDLAEPEDLVSVYVEITDRYGVPDVLVNNAGLFRAEGFLETDSEYLCELFAVNVRAPFLLTQLFVRDHQDEGAPGVVVNVSSVNGRRGSYDVAYSASKAAVIGMTRSLGRELADAGIRINAVAPGLVSTPMLEGVSPDVLARREAEIPMHRAADPDEIAAVICFLAGDASSYMTGAVVDVNGGIY